MWHSTAATSDLSSRGDFYSEGLSPLSPTAGSPSVLLRLNHLMFILDIGPQPIPWGLDLHHTAALKHLMCTAFEALCTLLHAGLPQPLAIKWMRL